MKVLTCSRFFPKGHPKAGQPTHFVEKIEACLADTIPGWEMSPTFALHDWEPYYNCTMPKGHTIRAGNRFKVGEMVSLRVWADKPYRSKQIEFAQVEVKKVWPVTITIGGAYCTVYSGDALLPICVVAKNDGLECEDFVKWFSIHPNATEEVFTGQIICWNDSITYPSK